MIVKLLFKRVIPGFFVYYGGVQAYLVYHLLLRGQGRVRAPKLPPITPRGSRKSLVENILSMYHGTATSANFAIYTEDVQFGDPIVTIKGIDGLRNIGFMMRATAKPKILSIKEHHYEDQVILELQQRYTMLGMEVKMPINVYVELKGKTEDQKVKKMTEEWFGKPLITPENTPFLYTGVTASFFRDVHGKLFSLMKYDEPKI